jgi:RNA polymerase sigma-54 factor
VLRDIAIATELHESTVSRVTSNKYIATPRGIFELKYFFTSALPARTPGVVVSSESVRSRIRILVNAESSGQPLSDDRIVDLLKGEGIEIARRTVAKYREAMRIPSSAERRRLGRLGMGRSMPSGVPSAAIAAQALAGPAD